MFRFSILQSKIIGIFYTDGCMKKMQRIIVCFWMRYFLSDTDHKHEVLRSRVYSYNSMIIYIVKTGYWPAYNKKIIIIIILMLNNSTNHRGDKFSPAIC